MANINSSFNSNTKLVFKVIGIIFIVLLVISFGRTLFGTASFNEPLTFRAFLDVLSNSPVIDFTAKIQIPTIDISVSWLTWVEYLVNPSIQIINLLVWVVSQLFNFMYFLTYLLRGLVSYNLGF